MKSILRKIKHLTLHTLASIAYLASTAIPRKQNLWVFIGWHRSRNGEIFADNTRHFFIYIKEVAPDITPYWITGDHILIRQLQSQGIKVCHEKSLRGIWVQLRAQCVVIDAFLQPYNALFSRNAKIIQLLHGKGLKRKGYAGIPLQKNDYIFGTSPFANSLLPHEFIDGAQLCVTGYSRNDYLFNRKETHLSAEEQQLIAILERHRQQNATVILYAPTFRRGQKTLDPNEHFNLTQAQKFAELHNCIFLVSLHTKYRAQKELYQTGKIIGLPECDVNILMPYIDILITDYSSSYIDYLLLDRPIVFYIHDIDEYNKNEGLIEDYEDHMPGAKVRNQDEVFATLAEIMRGNDSWAEERKKVRDLYHTYQDGNSSERIFKILSKSQTSSPDKH